MAKKRLKYVVMDYTSGAQLYPLMGESGESLRRAADVLVPGTVFGKGETLSGAAEECRERMNAASCQCGGVCHKKDAESKRRSA